MNNAGFGSFRLSLLMLFPAITSILFGFFVLFPTATAKRNVFADLETAVGTSFDPHKTRLPLTKPLKKTNDDVVIITAVGDSITEGSCSSDEATKSWPSQLFDMLGANQDTFIVYNYGVSGRTMMKTGDYPYWNEEAYQLALESEADIIYLMLGTNDAKTYQWNQTEYINDYIEMAQSFLDMNSKPFLYIMVPPPLYKDGVYSMNQTVINEEFPIIIPNDILNPLILQYGQDRLSLISIFNNMGGNELTKYEAFCDYQNCDQCHPNDAGYGALAMATFKAYIEPIP